MSRFQPLDASHVPTAGVQVRQTQHVLFVQGPERLLQGRADGGVQTRIGNGHVLRQDRGEQAGEEQGQNDAKHTSKFHTNWRPRRRAGSSKVMGLETHCLLPAINRSFWPSQEGNGENCNGGHTKYSKEQAFPVTSGAKGCHESRKHARFSPNPNSVWYANTHGTARTWQ